MVYSYRDVLWILLNLRFLIIERLYKENRYKKEKHI